MLTTSSPTNDVRKFIASNFLYGQDRNFGNDDSFLGEGIIDSTGVLQLVSFLEEAYGISVEDEELRPDNLDSVNNITAYLSRKLGTAARIGTPSQPAMLQEELA